MSINALNVQADKFDVFLCHNRKDKPEVRDIADTLKRHGIKPWLDERDIDLGTDWETEINTQLASTELALIFIGNHGIGDYQEKEIQDLINRSNTLKIIPVMLLSAPPNSVWPEEISRYQGIDFRKEIPPPLTQLLLGIIGDRHPSRINTPPPDDKEWNIQKQRSELQILLNHVNDFWVESKLKSSLYSQVISVGKTVLSDLVKYEGNKLDVLCNQGDRHHLAREVPIEYVLDVTKYLLILGESGSGKTTTLLELAQNLISRANEHANEYIPVVLDLSHWKKGQSLFDWMVDTLAQMHKLRKEYFRDWLEKKYLIPLLDGLDETKADRLECIQAINTFITKKEPPALVVCSRLEDYITLLPSLRKKTDDSIFIDFELNGAIRLEPLDRKQIDLYLEKLEPKSQNIQSAIDTDANLQALAQYPLMLSIISKIYQSDRPELVLEPSQTLAERRTQLFEAYVDWAFAHKEPQEQIFPRLNILYWLHWLAKKMNANQPAYFLIENLQANWLDNWQQQLTYRGIAALSFSILIGLMSLVIILKADLHNLASTYALMLALFMGLFVGSASRIKNGLICLAIFTLFGALNKDSANLADWFGDGVYLSLISAVGIGTLHSITTIEIMNWSWALFLKIFFRVFVVGWLAAGLCSGLIYLNQGHNLQDSLPFGLLLGLLFALLSGLICGLISGFTARIREGKIKPNQGMLLTLENGLVAFFVAVLAIGLVEWSIYLLSGFQDEALTIGLILGLQFGLVIGLRLGLASVIKHYALRLTLCLSGSTPLKLIPFLDYCDKIILLNRGAGSYSFLHRTFQEYFANLDISPSKASNPKVTKNSESQR